jgi:hypothetical protein
MIPRGAQAQLAPASFSTLFQMSKQDRRNGVFILPNKKSQPENADWDFLVDPTGLEPVASPIAQAYRDALLFLITFIIYGP